ncbi:MAG: acetyl-CoA carboxylase biotin carboxylase subunit, partial [Sedimentisphaerales bacterium]|nr:acetyl-CoA carboxylase biotin carboxylase subunit [Sedimentisphaerales bacterium]
SVVVYSEADRDASYLKFADRAICIGKASPAESYLNIPSIISAAEIANVEAIHPGYGFLAENAHFADVCRDCKIKFIGPSPESMRLLGDKVAARNLAIRSKVPVVPGSEGALTSEEDAVKLAEKIGYPVMVKASAGGGGRGMRVCHSEMNLRTAYHSARSEAQGAFGNPDVFLEKFIENPRHVEVQVLADEHGNYLHLWERDCSLQRRHQKLIEESPSPNLNQDQREELCKAALRVVKAAEYYNAGTVEFLMDKQGNFYFGEVNTRIQVEHPVTEMVTGVDLVRWQLRIASGEKLDLKQKEIVQTGHAIECRINAEDPYENFRPSPGPLNEYIAPGGFGVRIDSHCYAGFRISPNYDSMIAKLIVHGSDRTDAIRRARRALDEYRIGPIKSTIPICHEILSHPDFAEGKCDTGFIGRTWGVK